MTPPVKNDPDEDLSVKPYIVQYFYWSALALSAALAVADVGYGVEAVQGFWIVGLPYIVASVALMIWGDALSMEAYTFQILADDDILACTDELQIPLTIESLKRPTMATMTTVYERFVLLLMGEPGEPLPAADEIAQDIFDYPELYEYAIARGELRRRLIKLMNACGVDDFSLADVIKPTYKRTKRNLSGLINFAKFRESQLPAYQRHADATEARLIELEQIQEEEDAAREELAMLEEEQAAQAPLVDELTERNKELVQAINAKHSQQAQIREDLKVLKENLAKTKESVTNLEFQIVSERQAVNNLKAQIVSSPEKLESRIASLARQEREVKDELAQVQSKTKGYRSKLDNVATLTSAFQNLLTLLDGAEAEHDKASAVVEQISELQRAATDADAAYAELERTEEYSQLNLESTQEKLARTEVQAESKKAAAEAALARARTEFSACEAEFQSAKVKIDENAVVIRELRDKMERELMAHENEVAAMEDAYDELRDHVKSYHEQLFECIATGVVPSSDPTPIPADVAYKLASSTSSNLTASQLDTSSLNREVRPTGSAAAAPAAPAATTPVTASLPPMAPTTSLRSSRASIADSSSLRASLLGSTGSSKPKRRTSFVASLR